MLVPLLVNHLSTAGRTEGGIAGIARAKRVRASPTIK